MASCVEGSGLLKNDVSRINQWKLCEMTYKKKKNESFIISGKRKLVIYYVDKGFKRFNRLWVWNFWDEGGGRGGTDSFE